MIGKWFLPHPWARWQLCSAPFILRTWAFKLYIYCFKKWTRGALGTGDNISCLRIIAYLSLGSHVEGNRVSWREIGWIAYRIWTWVAVGEQGEEVFLCPFTELSSSGFWSHLSSPLHFSSAVNWESRSWPVAQSFLGWGVGEQDVEPREMNGSRSWEFFMAITCLA